MIPFLVILPLVVYSCSVYSYSQTSEENRFSLRKLLENLDVTSNFTSAANMSNMTTSTPSLLPQAIIQIVDEQGLVIDKASTNQNIRLKVKALTTREYQSPFIKKCWYDEYKSMPDGETKPSKTEIFVEKGCVEQESNLLKTTAVPFEENGVLEAQTNLFNLMPLYDDKFSILVINCEAMLCRTNVTCVVTCSKRRKMWKMDRSADKLALSVAFEVQKKKQPQTERQTKPDLNDFLIGGGRQPPSPRILASTESPLLQRYQPYFAVSTLGVVVLLLLCVIGIGYMFISYKNNKKYDNVSFNQADYTNNKLTGIHDVGDINHQGGGISTKQQLTSPPPAYTNASACVDADQRLRSPYRNTCIGTPNEGMVLEARQLYRDKISAGRLQDLVNRRLPVNDDPHDVCRYEGGMGGVQTNLYCGWNESPQRYRESVNVPTSPVGGEFYPAQSRRSRSPSSERLLPKSPVRGQENASLIRAALKDYFEKYGM